MVHPFNPTKEPSSSSPRIRHNSPYAKSVEDILPDPQVELELLFIKINLDPKHRAE
ncbi:ACT domain-containing small subunit of acetolactate synthase protein, partial [Perilla frutescens var. hirtella]